MSAIIVVSQLSKTYSSGFQALKSIDLHIEAGEIFALLGPNGAGKTTLISIVCGIVKPSSGRVLVNGADVVEEYRKARMQIGLVPQELALSMFETVWATVKFSRGLYGKAPDDAYLESVLRSLALWDKRDSRIMSLSGGMKRRLLIAKALSHEPRILFLDEPTAGVDVNLRQEMWGMIQQLRERGVTIILTTHYIEEAEEMADRIGVIRSGEIILVDHKAALMKELGRKQLSVQLASPLLALPDALASFALRLEDDGCKLVYEFDSNDEDNRIPQLLKALDEEALEMRDLHTRQSSLEDIFVRLVEGEA